MNSNFLTSSAIAFLLIAPPIVAEEFTAKTRGAKFDQPDGATAGTQFESSFSIQAGDGDGKATLILNRLSKVPTLGKYFRYQLKLSAPFDSKKQENVDVGALAKVASGTSVGIEWSYIDWRPVENDDVKHEIQLAVCERAVPELIPGYSLDLIALGGAPYGCSVEGLTNKALLSDSVATVNATRTACKATADKEQCKMLLAAPEAKLAENIDNVIASVQPLLVQVTDELVSPIGVWTIGLTGNRQKFEYVLPTAPADAIKQNENGWSATLAYTRLYQNNLWSVGYSHEETYKAGSKAEVCVPLGTAGALTCVERIIGAPTEKTSELLFGEYRTLTTASFAISPRVEYDLKDSEWGVRVPIYFVTNKKEQLTAGIALGWTEEGGSGAAVFVGKSFKFLD